MIIPGEFVQKTRSFPTPFVVYNLGQLRTNYETIRDAFPGVGVHYSMKPNSHPRIVTSLEKLGCNFEVSSLAETKYLIGQGIDASRIICMHPIKSPQFLQYLQKEQILIMAVDSIEEVDKIVRYAPDARLVVRVTVDNQGSSWQLTGKFGIEVTEVSKLFQYIIDKKLNAYGLTFHVGSQCVEIANWLKALYICNDVWNKAKEAGIQIQFLSLGGGLAVKYRDPVPTTKEVSALVMKELKRNFNSGTKISFSLEPGRAIVADTGILVTSITGLAKRETKQWAYIDIGTYNGLVEAIETPDRQFYPIAVESNSKKRQVYNIGGPTCVSLDTPFENVELPELHLNDRLYIYNTGAYVIPCAAPFNGFSIPNEYIWEDL